MISKDIFQNLDIDKKWYVAYSGGPDSACLLGLLVTYKKYLKDQENIDLNIGAIHINHNIRKEEAIRDMNFCRVFCENNQIDFKLHNVYVPKYAKENKMTIEQAARHLRYQMFDEYSDDLVFLGHNKDDNSETIFLNILRGSGLKGMLGMEKAVKHYVRPLLDFSKDEILDYNKKNNIPYIQDSTNESNEYFRNYIRNTIFPQLNEKFQKDVRNNLLSTADILKDVYDYLDKKVLEEYNKRVNLIDSVLTLDISSFDSLDKIIKDELLRKAISQVKGDLVDVERKHINLVTEFLKSGQSGTSIDLKDQIQVLLLQNERVRIYKKREALGPIEFEHKVELVGNTYIESRSLLIKSEIITYKKDKVDKNNDCNRVVIIRYFDNADRLVIRTRKAGDIFSSSKGVGSRILRKYLIDKKIDKDLRDSIFLLAVDNEIVYIENNEIGKRFIPIEGLKAIRLEFEYGFTL